jgi:hypothetical protein
VHPAFALTRTRLTETRSEFDSFLQANEKQLIPLEQNQDASAAWLRTVSRASGIEGVYTGMENVLKEILSVVDGGVFGKPESYHAQLLAQAAEKTDKREAVVDPELYKQLDELRSFRHRERSSYRHLLKEDLVNANLELLKETFPLFEAQILAFIASWEHKPKDDDEPTSSSHTV